MKRKLYNICTDPIMNKIIRRDRNPRLEIYKAKDGWRWRLFARNGRIVAESGEAYRNKPHLRKLLVRLDGAFMDAWRVFHD